MISAKANFLITLLHRKPRSKGERGEGRGRGNEVDIGPSIFLWKKGSVETSGSFLPPPSIDNDCFIIYCGDHQDRLSTSNQRRVEDKRAKKKLVGRTWRWWSTLFFSTRLLQKEADHSPSTPRPRLFVPSRITPLDESSNEARLSFVFANQTFFFIGRSF